MDGNKSSSIPTTCILENSNPFAAWMVIKETLLTSSSSPLSASVSNATSIKKSPRATREPSSEFF